MLFGARILKGDMKTKYKILVITVPAVFIADQLTKWLVVNFMEVGEKIPIVPGLFDIVHFRNTGAAFGLFSSLSEAVRTPFFYIVAAVAAVLLALLYRTLGDRERLMPLAISLVFGGIAGNILDRLRHGSVVDFLSLHAGDAVVTGNAFGIHYSFPIEWPAFNIADSAITVAMILIVVSAVRGRRGEYQGGR